MLGPAAVAAPTTNPSGDVGLALRVYTRVSSPSQSGVDRHSVTQSVVLNVAAETMVSSANSSAKTDTEALAASSDRKA